MKRLLALLLLAVAPAFAQELPPTYVNTGNLINNTYPQTYGFADGVPPFEQVGIGSVVFDPNDWDGDGAYYQFSYMPGAIIIELDISSLQVNNLSVFLTSFAFKTDCNNQIGGYCEDPFGMQDWIRSRMELFTSEGLFGSYNMFNSGDGTFYSYTGAEWAGAFNYVNSGMVDLNSETAYFTSARLIIEGQDMGYWGGLYGPKIDSLNLQIEYDSALQGLVIQPIAPDCTVNPNDPTCIINDLIDFTDEEPIMLADSGSDNGSNDGTIIVEKEDPSPAEELLALEESTIEVVEESVTEEPLEELLAEEDEEIDEETAVVASTIKEMVNEEKAATLSDSISKNTLEAALAIAGSAETSSLAVGSASADSSTSTTSSTSSRTDSAVSANAEQSTTESTQSVASAETVQESSNAGDASMELLETGRTLGQEALAATMAATEASANESVSEAESVAFVSSVDSAVASSSTVETINSIEIESIAETVVADSSNAEVSNEIAVFADTNNVDSSASQEQQGLDLRFAEGNSSVAAEQETEDLTLAIVNASVAEQKTFEDDSNKDAETTNAMVDPAFAIANTFNQPPSMMSLEILGIVKPIEEKSDAELRAEQVIAANKEEQEAINANYMEADQSGILAAIGSETDVSAYRNAMLRDASAWYKPEDIYKNIVIKDNVRGSYFLEKGNTDTYKRMVEEQYKDE